MTQRSASAFDLMLAQVYASQDPELILNRNAVGALQKVVSGQTDEIYNAQTVRGMSVLIMKRAYGDLIAAINDADEDMHPTFVKGICKGLNKLPLAERAPLLREFYEYQTECSDLPLILQDVCIELSQKHIHRREHAEWFEFRAGLSPNDALLNGVAYGVYRVMGPMLADGRCDLLIDQEIRLQYAEKENSDPEHVKARISEKAIYGLEDNEDRAALAAIAIHRSVLGLCIAEDTEALTAVLCEAFPKQGKSQDASVNANPNEGQELSWLPQKLTCEKFQAAVTTGLKIFFEIFEEANNIQSVTKAIHLLSEFPALHGLADEHLPAIIEAIRSDDAPDHHEYFCTILSAAQRIADIHPQWLKSFGRPPASALSPSAGSKLVLA